MFFVFFYSNEFTITEACAQVVKHRPKQHLCQFHAELISIKGTYNQTICMSTLVYL